MEYAEDGSQGSYHTPKLGEENVVPIPMVEPTLPPADQSLPLSNQENIPPQMVMPLPLNVLVPVPEECHGHGKNSGRFSLNFLVFFTFTLLTLHFAY